ncbi:MAG: sigma-70 family RNA polymerase sigma factor [Lachnospiraceae bacterium]|nr:sigma-70 family RNA polymerase sigma factor [Lachnospiraceae bacterium]
MSEWIRIRVKDFYKDAIGETEYTYVTREVYEALTETFRKEAHAQQMRDLRHISKECYTEGATEELAFDSTESLEDMVIRHIELETLQKAMQSLTDAQKERLHLYFFEGLTIREIAERQGVNRNAVWKSIQGIIAQMKRFFE